MNQNDSQLIKTILDEAGYNNSDNNLDADIVLINTCAIRANAENRVLTRLS